MEIRFFRNDEIDRKRWDECIEGSYNGALYALSWYLDATADYWDALVADDYAMVFPLTYYKKAGFKVLRQPIHAQQLGLFSKAAINEDIVLRFLKAIPKSFRLGSLHLNAQNIIPIDKGFSVENRINIELALEGGVEELRKNYNRNNRRNLMKAHSNGITIKAGTDFSRIITTFRDNLGSERYHVSDNCYKISYRLFEVLQKRGMLTIYEAYDSDGQFVAGIILTVYKDRTIALFSGCTREGYKILASHLLFDYSIEQAVVGQSKIFDFEGSNTESVAFVFHGFGGLTVPYQLVAINNASGFFNKIFSLMKKIRRK